MLNKIKLVAITIVVLAFAGTLVYAYIMKKDAEAAKAKLETLKQENETLVSALEFQTAEKERIEKLLSNRMSEMEKIRKESAARLAKKDSELKELRKKNEEVDAYLNSPVPRAYLDWMRGKNGNKGD